MAQNTILSLIQPTGDMHLGNYFGAVKNWVDLQQDHACIYGVANYHTMTMPYLPDQLRENTWEMIFRLIATGVNVENLFIQSLVPEHTELCWILSTVCSYGELSRMTQFKDKSAQNQEKSSDSLISAGLLFYPILMAADILIYHADYVPVGKDQDQHLELSRNIAARFNNTFNTDYFTHPEPKFTEFPKIYSLADPEKKMSKSLGNKHYINLFGDKQQIEKQVKSAVTDSGPVKDGVVSPGVENLFTLLSALGHSDQVEQFRIAYFGGTLMYGHLKSFVAEAVTELTERMNANLQEVYAKKDSIIRQVYESSLEKRKIAAKTLEEVREITGLPSLKY